MIFLKPGPNFALVKFMTGLGRLKRGEWLIEKLPLLRPMLAVSSKPFDSPDFIYEIKWDGFRCLAYLGKERTVLRSRNLWEMTPAFPELAGLHSFVKGCPALLDGEIVVFKNGLPSFGSLQARALGSDSLRIKQLAGKEPALFIAFDLLYVSGASCLDEPLEKRKDLLARSVAAGGPAVVVEFISGAGRDFFQACAAKGLEGVVAKRLGSPYLPGKRSPAWLKFRHVREMELLICGYQTGRGGRKLGALILGERTNGKTIYRGKVGTGFSRREEEKLLALLDGLAIDEPAVFTPANEGRHICWVRPLLICSVNYLGLTEEGLLRHPLYRGIRWDKLEWDKLE